MIFPMIQKLSKSSKSAVRFQAYTSYIDSFVWFKRGSCRSRCVISGNINLKFFEQFELRNCSTNKKIRAMNTRIGLMITAAAGVAAFIYSRWKKRFVNINTEKDHQHEKSNLSYPPKWHNQIKNLPDIDAADIVSLQYANSSISSNSNEVAQNLAKHVPYHQRGKRHH